MNASFDEFRVFGYSKKNLGLCNLLRSFEKSIIHKAMIDMLLEANLDSKYFLLFITFAKTDHNFLYWCEKFAEGSLTIFL